MRSVQGIILAAGEGTRMKSELPKVLHPICGRPMIGYALNLAAAAGIKQPVVVLGKGAELVKPHLPKEAKAVIQQQRSGTGDAVLAAKKSLSTAGEVLILYGDTPLLRRTTVQKLIETHFKTGATCTLLTAHLADPGGYGRIFRDETGKVTGIIEEAEANTAQRAIREVNVGTLIVNAQALFDALATVTPSSSKKELYLTQIVSHIAKLEGTKVNVSKVEEVSEALGINSRAELARATGVIRNRIIESHLQNGVTIEDPQSTFIDYGVSIGVDSTIRPYTVIETGVSIGKRCTIGPLARLRSGVSISDDVKIGNFAELVRTKVGSDVRMNHVSYLGDAIVEDGVNIGAGTITANYDGKNKNTTHIGKGAFIGSDTVLIAPVKIGAGAITGAGSVVTRDHDVPARSTVVGVPARAMGSTNGKHEPAVKRAEAPVKLKSDRKITSVKSKAKKPKARVKVKAKAKTKAQPKRVVSKKKKTAKKTKTRLAKKAKR